MVLHTWSLLLTVGHGWSRTVTLRHPPLFFVMLVRAWSYLVALFHVVIHCHYRSRIIMNSHAWPLFLATLPLVHDSSHMVILIVVTLGHTWLTLCHPSLLFVKLVRAKFYFVTIFTLSLIIMLGHAWSRIFTLGSAFSRLLCLCKFLLARSIFLTLFHALSRSITVGHAWSRIFILGNSWPLFLAIVTQVQVFSLMVTLCHE
jgi:hypothetical protein